MAFHGLGVALKFFLPRISSNIQRKAARPTHNDGGHCQCWSPKWLIIIFLNEKWIKTCHFGVSHPSFGPGPRCLRVPRSCVRQRIMRAFLIEEQKCVKQVLAEKLSQAKEKETGYFGRRNWSFSPHLFAGGRGTFGPDLL